MLFFALQLFSFYNNDYDYDEGNSTNTSCASNSTSTFFLLQKCIRKLRIYIYIYQLDRTDYKLTLRCIQTIPVKQENENKNISNNVSLTQNKE